MANLIVDGFDWFPSGQSSSTRTRLWSANGWFEANSGVNQTSGPADITTGRFSFGNALNLPSTSSVGANYQRYVAPIGKLVSEGYIGAAVQYPSSNSASGRGHFAFYDGVNDIAQMVLSLRSNGIIDLWRGSPISGTLLQSSVTGVFQEDEWFHLEIHGVIDNSSGVCEVRVNTVPVLSVTGFDSQNGSLSTFDSVAIAASCSTNTNALIYVDDFFVNDTTGAHNNTWLGNVRVKTQFMTANGATNQFTIGGSAPAATNWQSVLNQLLDDTEYVYDSNAGDIDLYVPDPNLNSPLVHALQVRMGLRQDDATQRAAQALLRIGSTLYPSGVDAYTNQTYTFYKQLWELNPATGVSFTGSDVNGLQAGVKLTI